MLRKLLNLLKGRNTNDTVSKSKLKFETHSYTMRHRELVQTDVVFDAWTSQDLSKMIKALDSKTNLIDRHHLLMSIVNESYKLRNDNPDMRKLCVNISERHIAEFPQIRKALLKDLGGFLPRVTTFQNYATLLVEEHKFQKAIEVCESAISFGLSDGTKGDYIGRIERIKKKAGIKNA